MEKIHGIMMAYDPSEDVLIRTVHVEWAGSPDKSEWTWEPAANFDENEAYIRFLALPAQKAWRDPNYVPPGKMKPGKKLNQQK